MPMVEMGQGTYTSLAMLLAEELEVGLDQVRLEHAPPNDALYANAILHVQTTGLSSSVRAFWTPLRQAGAVARTLLIAAAAKQWGVDPAACRAQHGVVSDQGRRQPGLRRAGGRRRGPAGAGARQRGAEGSEGLHADRHAGQAAGHAGQGRWPRGITASTPSCRG